MDGRGGASHTAIMGGSGSGKTVMAAAMLRAIREQAPVPLLAFDFKGDLAGFSGTQGEAAIGETFETQAIEPPRMPIPLDVLSLSQNDQFGIDEAAMRFRESFSRLKGSKLGSIQRNYVHEAASRALSSEEPCELRHIRDRLLEVYQEHEAKEDGAVSSMEELCRFPLFDSTFPNSIIIAANYDQETGFDQLELEAMADEEGDVIGSAEDTNGWQIIENDDGCHQLVN